MEAATRDQLRKFIGQCAALLLILFWSFPAPAERLPVKTYTVADGLLRDVVYRIKQDSRGFLWFCTAEGISRFDGVGMMNLTVRDGLPDRFVHDFLETRDGTIYIATGKGLARLNPHGLRGSAESPLFTNFLPENPKAENIRILYQSGKGQIWVGTSDGLYKLVESDGRVKFENVLLGEPLQSSGGAVFAPSPNTLSISAVLEDRNGIFWIGTNGGGLFRLSPDGKVRRYTESDVLSDNKITDLIEDRTGQIWMSLRSDEKGGVCLLDAANAENPVKKCYTAADGLSSNWVRDIEETGNGQIWLATVPGLCRFQPENPGSVCKTYSAQNDLCDDMLALAEDKDGNLWTGSACGAKKIARHGFTTYGERDGLDKDHVSSIFENSKGELFVTTFPKNERVISRFDGERFTSVKPKFPEYVDYHGWGWKQTVWQDSKGAWWLPTGYGGFRSPDNTSFKDLAAAPLEKQEMGAKGAEILRLFEDSRGDIWVLTTNAANELFCWERAKNIWHDFTAQAGFSKFRVGSAFAEDLNGNIWIGGTSEHDDSALIRFRNGKFRVFTQAEGAPAGWIQDLFIDSKGRLWIASDNEGLWRLDDPDSENFDFVKYTTAEGLKSNSTASITEDAYGRIYVGTWHGIDRLTPDTGQVENFTTADGLPTSFIESAYRDRRGQLWFATDRGLTRFVPEPLRPRRPPTILITGLRVEGLSQSVSILGETEIPPLDLNPGQRQITVDFIGLGASLGEKLKYEYRFGRGDWTATDERTLNFANLASGDYRLEIRAQTADRISSPNPAVLSFRIAAPVWQRWWFIALAGISAGLLIYAFYRNRLNRLLEIERTRTRIATDLHDDIGANLSKISLLSDVVNMQISEEREESKRMLTTIAEVSRSSVAAMRDIVWAINPQSDSVLEMTRKMRQYAEETFVPKNVFLRFEAPLDGAKIKLSMDLRRELFLIFKEAVNNAARHAECGKMEIKFSVAAGEVFLLIRDDGRGFDPAGQFDGNGLVNMKARAERIGGLCSIRSEPGIGTTVKIKI
ncbi:MAG: two-component regulator propeller domain-containing protein [Pyrinomonadaceae bacterium]